MAKILIIDDDALLTALLALRFGSAGHVVDVAHDGSDGIALALADPPDLVLLDQMMPAMAGPEVLARLRGDPRTARTPVIILSALYTPAERREAAELGAADYIAKPFVSGELVSRVEAVLEAGRRDAV